MLGEKIKCYCGEKRSCCFGMRRRVSFEGDCARGASLAFCTRGETARQQRVIVDFRR